LKIQPLISIIIPSYNRAGIIKDTLDSIVKQTYENWECIVVDDGSTDETYKVVTEYGLMDDRFQYHSRPQNLRKGACSCRNYGFELSKGVYVTWLDSDDVFSENKIASQVNVLKNEDVGVVVTSKWDRFSESTKGLTFKKSIVNRDYSKGIDLLLDFGKNNYFYPCHSYLICKSIILKSGLWNESLSINQDGEFFARVLLNCSRVIHPKKGIAYYRQSLNNVSVSSFSDKTKAIDAIQSWILIDSYIKIYTKTITSCKYVLNAKSYLNQEINDNEILSEYSFFIGRKNFLSRIKQLINKFL
jgi:glycosyltransferase involved in cell wall biosynthesis